MATYIALPVSVSPCMYCSCIILCIDIVKIKVNVDVPVKQPFPLAKED